MNEPQAPITAIREVLFRNAETLNRQLLKRFADTADHVSRHEDRAVIGALDGAEADTQRIRNLRLLARDCFPLPDEERGAP
jgi:hypothetical protein